MALPAELLAVTLGAVLDRTVVIAGATPVGGGCINEAVRLDTSAGPFFAKWHPRPPGGMFSAEALGLAALRASGAPLVVPEPIAWHDGEEGAPGFLVTEWLAAGQPGPDFDERLGAGLADLHRATAPAF